MKQCTRCCQLYPEWSREYFYPSGFLKSGKEKLRSHCIGCEHQIRKERLKKTREGNPEQYVKLLEKRKKYSSRYYEDYKKRDLQKLRESRTICARRWRKNNPEKANLIVRKYREKHPEVVAAQSLRRRTQCVKACPSWADTTKINLVYKEARRRTLITGIRHAVDHIDPLRGELICGLHVPENLRVVTREENSRKKNRFKPYTVEFFASGVGRVVRYV